MRRRALAAALLGLPLGMAAAAEVHGRLLSASHVAIRPGVSKRFIQNTQLGDLHIRESMDDGPRFEGSVRLRLEPEGIDPSRHAFEGEIHDFYLTLRRGDFDLVFGQRVKTWGLGDVVNPNRFYGAKDNTLLLSNETDKEIPTPQISVGWTPGGGAWSWQFVYLPRFIAEKVYMPSTVLPAGLTIEDTVEERDEGWGGGGGVRLAYTGEGYDVAAIGFVGFDPRPEYEVRFLGTTPKLYTLYRKQIGAGLEASTSTGSWIFRGETSFRHFVSESDRDPFLLQRAEGVFGVERPFGTGWRVMAQLIGSWSRVSIHSSEVAVTDTTGSRALIQFNENLYRAQSDFSYGSSVRIGYDSEESPFTAELFGLGYPSEGDFLARASVGWKPATGLKLLVGSDYYHGPSDSFFGGLKDLSSVWAELSGEF